MPPKQKRKASSSNNSGPKPKKQKIVDKDPSVVDSGFQNINHDIAKTLLDHLKLSTYDLKALSETCSSWHVKISTYLREMWVHTLPFTHQNFIKKQKIETMAAIGKARKYTSDIQILEFNESVSYHERTISIPWCPYIIVPVSRDGASILDLRKPDPIVPCPKGTFKHYWGNIMVVTNAKRKQLLLSKRALSKNDRQEEGCNGPYTHAFCIYNVSDDGKVDLVKQIDTKEEKSPFAAYMQDDGSIWVAWHGWTSLKLGKSFGNAKQILVSKRALAMNNGKNQIYIHTFSIYSVSDDGKLDLVKQIRRKSKAKSPPRTAHLRDDGSIWVAWKSKIAVYNDSQVEIYNYPGKLGDLGREPKSEVNGFIEHQGTLKIILHRFEGIEEEDYNFEDDPVEIIFLYDTETRQHVQLPIRVDGDGNNKYQYFNDSLQLTSNGNFTASCNLDPIQREFEGDHYNEASDRYFTFSTRFSLSPDGSRLLEYKLGSLNMPIRFKHKAYTRTRNQQDYNTMVQSHILFSEYPVNENEDLKDDDRTDPQLLSFLWLCNDIVIGIHANRIAVLDFRYAAPEGGFKSFELQFLNNVYWYRFARLSDTSFVIVSADPDVVAFKITV